MYENDKIFSLHDSSKYVLKGCESCAKIITHTQTEDNVRTTVDKQNS